MTTVIPPSGPVTNNAPVSTQNLREAAARYIYLGSSALAPEVLVAAQDEMKQRIARGNCLGLTERDVIVGLLRPVVLDNGHCRCPSCRSHCPVCGYTGS